MKALSEKRLNIFSEDKAKKFDDFAGIDGNQLLKNPFDVPLKKKKRRR